MPNMEAVTVADALGTKYGIPVYLHSDQGTQFESHLFQETCRLIGIKKTHTTPFRPQSDGQSERSIKTLVKMMATATKDQTEWTPVSRASPLPTVLRPWPAQECPIC